MRDCQKRLARPDGHRAPTVRRPYRRALRMRSDWLRARMNTALGLLILPATFPCQSVVGARGTGAYTHSPSLLSPLPLLCLLSSLHSIRWLVLATISPLARRAQPLYIIMKNSTLCPSDNKQIADQSGFWSSGMSGSVTFWEVAATEVVIVLNTGSSRGEDATFVLVVFAAKRELRVTTNHGRLYILNGPVTAAVRVIAHSQMTWP